VIPAGTIEGGRMPAPAGAAPLPCLFSDNSDESPRADAAWLSSEQRKTAHALSANVVQFAETYGILNCGFLTITFEPKSLQAEANLRGLTLWQEAQRRFNNAHRRLIRPLFGDYIRVLEFTERGIPHYHLVVDCAGDISTGFNWEHYQRTRDWSRSGRIGPKPSGSLDRTAHLVELHEQLRNQGPGYGLGRIELVPIRSTAEAIGRYVGGYLSYSLGGKQPDQKGARLVCYSKTFERRVRMSCTYTDEVTGERVSMRTGIAWVGERAAIWRRKLETWATRHGCSDLAQVAAIFGPKWAYHHRENIERTEINEDKQRERTSISGDLRADRRSCTDRPGPECRGPSDVSDQGTGNRPPASNQRPPGTNTFAQLEALSAANQEARGGLSLPQPDQEQGMGDGLASNAPENDRPQHLQSEPRKYVLGTPWAETLTEVSQEAGAKRLAAKMRKQAQYRKAVPQLIQETYPHLAAKLRKRWEEAQPGQADEPF
jgi:hypothetical protein